MNGCARPPCGSNFTPESQFQCYVLFCLGGALKGLVPECCRSVDVYSSAMFFVFAHAAHSRDWYPSAADQKTPMLALLFRFAQAAHSRDWYPSVADQRTFLLAASFCFPQVHSGDWYHSANNQWTFSVSSTTSVYPSGVSQGIGTQVPPQRIVRQNSVRPQASVRLRLSFRTIPASPVPS